MLTNKSVDIYYAFYILAASVEIKNKPKNLKPMEEIGIFSAFSVIAGIVLFIVILINNSDKGTGKPANGWWIPSSGFLIVYAVLLPSYLGLRVSKCPTETTIIKWAMFIILGISVISWIVGKIYRHRDVLKEFWVSVISWIAYKFHRSAK